MHRIDHSTANATPPTPAAPGTPGYFITGNPQAGQAATVVTADFANAVQEELAHVITQSGLTLSKTDNTQLRQAILKLVQDSNSAVIITGAVFEASVTNGEAVRWGAGNNRFDEAIADGTANNRAVGIADVTNSRVFAYGETSALFSGLTPGAKYFLSASTPGSITTTAPSDAVAVGIAKSATVVFVDVDASTALTGVALLSAAQTFSGAQRGAVTALTSAAASIAVNLALNNNFSHTTTENTTLAAPSNAVEGQPFTIAITQGATPRLLAYNTFYKFDDGVVPLLTATAGAKDLLVCLVLPGGASAHCGLRPGAA